MKGEKNWIWVLMALAICYAGSCTRVWAQENNELPEDVKLLQARIKELEEIVKARENTISRAEKALNRLRKELDEQIEENKRLLALCREAGIKTTKPAKTSLTPGEIVYRGKKRSQKWFDRMYERFHDKIAYVDGKYYDIGESLLKAKRISGGKTYPKGSIVTVSSGGEVLQVLGHGEALIFQEGVRVTSSGFSTRGFSSPGFSYKEPDILFHLTGYEGQLVDNQLFSFNGYLICVGTFEYTTALGAKKMVQSFEAYRPEALTREQFAEAISSGFELIDYKKVGEKIIKRPIR